MSGYVEVSGGVHLFTRDWGPKDGKAVVFVHGWPLSLEMFEYQMLELAGKGFRTVGVDLRGFGASDKPWGAHTFDVFADDLKTVLDTLDVQGATLVGFSMGGAVAVRYMARHRQTRVSKLVLMAAATPCLTKKPDFSQGLDNGVYDGFIAACTTDRAAANAGFVQATFHKPLSPSLADWFTRIGMQASPHATVEGVKALRDGDLRPDLAKITVPTLILHGVHDKVAPIGITAEVNHAAIKGATLVRFTESGHGLFLDEKNRCTEELIRFIG